MGKCKNCRNYNCDCKDLPFRYGVCRYFGTIFNDEVDNRCFHYVKEKPNIKAFIKRHRKTLLKGVQAVLMLAGLIIVFKFLNAVANGWRGYTGVGGEVFVFLLIFAPALIVKLRDSVHDFIDLFFRHK